MSRTSIGVALCTYNGSAFVDAQLESIAAQRRRPDSLVVVDDASLDDTVVRVQSFAARAPFPVEVVVNPENLGYRRNFEKAIALCGGDVIALSDQDDIWFPEKLERIGSVFDAEPGVVGVFSDAEVVGPELRPLGYRLWPTVGLTGAWREMAASGRMLELLVRRNVVTGATLAFRASLRDILLPVSTEVDHDAWIALLSATLGELRALDEPLIAYRQHGGNQIGAARESMLGRLSRAREMQRSGLERMRMQLTEALERVAAAEMGSTASRATMLEARDHLSARLALPVQRLRRLPGIVRDLRAGRYGRHANGLSSAVRDLFI